MDIFETFVIINGIFSVVLIIQYEREIRKWKKVMKTLDELRKMIK